MPLPPPSFTKSKWLAFFAELTAKLTHHNISVGIEGCEILQRLLTCRISVAALLQEGDLLQSLLDTIIGSIRSERLLGPSVALNEELTMTQLETLSLCVNMMISLHADGDAYYALLVRARAGAMIEGLVGLLQRGHPHFYGLLASTLATLLSLPIDRDPAVDLSQTLSDTKSVALRRHISELRELIKTHGSLLQDAVDALSAVVATSQGPQRFAAMRLLNMAHVRLKKYKLRHISGVDYDTSAERAAYQGGLNHSASAAAAAADADLTGYGSYTSLLNVTLTGAPPLPRGEAQQGGGGAAEPTPLSSSSPQPLPSPEQSRRVPHNTGVGAAEEDVSTVVDREPAPVPYHIPVDLPRGTLDAMRDCSSHEEFFTILSDLWCLAVADGKQLAEIFGAQHFKHFRKFLVSAPASRQDRTLFTSLLLWLGHLMSTLALLPDTRDAILDVTGGSLLGMLQAECSKNDMQRVRASVLGTGSSAGVDSGADMLGRSPAAAMSAGTRASSVLGVSSIHMQRHGDALRSVELDDHTLLPYAMARKREEAALVQTPSIATPILSFLLIVEKACSPQQIELWIRNGGILVIAERAIRRVEHVKSALIDTPTTVDGALSDEVYLSCAMSTVQTDGVTLAVLACKLVSSILWGHCTTIKQVLSAEALAFVQTMVPLLLKIAVQNPTLASATENVSASALYHSPTGLRSARYTSLGECAVVALDVNLWFSKVSELQCIDIADLLPSLPALSRCTRNSIHPPLRAVVYRTLMHLCTTPAHLFLVVRDMPSVINAAITSVLEYSPHVPQWEAAAAAEWLCTAIDIVSSDSKIEQNFNFTRTALPLKLLELSAASPLCYATASLLELCVAVCEQQKRFSEYYQEVSSSVLAPYGRRSLHAWTSLIQTATTANDRLSRISFQQQQHPNHRWLAPAVPTRDALSRALSSVESIAVQYSFTCTLLRSLKYLLESFPEHRQHFTHSMIYGLFLSTFSVPAPSMVFDLLSSRFSTQVDYHPTLTQSYNDMIQWACELAPLWFSVTNGVTAPDEFPPLPAELYNHLSRIMQDESIPQRTRCHIPLFVCSLLVLPNANEALYAGLESSSQSLFEASLSVKKLTCVSGMQCRLLRLFVHANESAHSSGWFAARILNLENLIRVLSENSGSFGTEDEEAYLVSLSFICSVLAMPSCRQLPREARQSICASLCEGVRHEGTRMSTMQALQAIACSDEGRRCLLHEVSASGEPLARSCFGRVLAVTLEIPTVWISQAEATRVAGSKTAAAAAGQQKQTVQRRHRQATVVLGYDICTLVCGQGDSAFVSAFLKHKGLEVVERLFREYDNQGSHRVGHPDTPCPIPLHLMRLVAALSFHAEVQKGILHHSTLFTILVEIAAVANVEGSLALLVVRNMCFHASLKTVLCQDARVLLTLKAALMGQPTVETLVLEPHADASLSSSPSSSPAAAVREDIASKNTAVVDWAKRVALRTSTTTAASSSPLKSASKKAGEGELSPIGEKENRLTTVKSLACDEQRLSAMCVASSPEVFRRQDLAVSAFWSLMYDHQRGKVYVKSILQQAPALSLNRLTPTPVLEAWRQQSMGSSGPDAAAAVPHTQQQEAAASAKSMHSRIADGIENMHFLSRGVF